VAGSTWVVGWHGVKPDLHLTDRARRNANELVEGRAVFP